MRLAIMAVAICIRIGVPKKEYDCSRKQFSKAASTNKDGCTSSSFQDNPPTQTELLGKPLHFTGALLKYISNSIF